MTRVLTIVLAGGEGKRLAPLTLDRAEPAVPFGGNYRLIDFALSNLVNASGGQRVQATAVCRPAMTRPTNGARAVRPRDPPGAAPRSTRTIQRSRTGR